MANLTFGREAVLDSMRDAVLGACAGRGRLVVVSGEPGIGKSTIAAAIAELAETRGAEVQWGRAWEFADAPAYFPVRQALRALDVDPQDPAFREEGGSFRLWETVALALASRSKPIVWLLEDLHAADLLTLDLLTFLAPAVRGLKVLIVVTTRAFDPRLDERALARLSRMARDGIDVRLEPLGPSAVAEIAAAVCGGPLPPSIIAKLSERTGGNPLFIVECARAFKTSGTFNALPSTVRQVVLDRFNLLFASSRTTLGYGAVLGREFTAALVGKMQGVLPARVIDDVLPALKSGLVSEIEPGRFVFSHVIVRDVVEETLSSMERARLHGLAAGALATAADTVDVVVERARHALEAAAAGDAAKAVELVRRAIRILEDEGAHDRAHALCERVGKTAHVASELTPADWMQHARIALAAGQVGACRRLTDRVLAHAREAGAAKEFTHAALLSGAVIRPAIVDTALVNVLEEARRMIGESDLELACRVEARLAAAMQPHEDFEIPCAMARAAIAKARALPERVLVEVLDTGISALVDFAPIEERLAAYNELLELATMLGDRPRILRAHGRLALDHAFLGDFEAFSKDVTAALQVASDLGHPRHRWKALLLSSMRALMFGNLADSERAIVEVMELATLTDDPPLPASIVGHRIHRAMMLHADDELRVLADGLSGVFGGAPYGIALTAGYRAIVHAWLEDEALTAQELRAMAGVAQLFEREISGGAILAPAYALAGTNEMRARLRSLLLPHVDRESIGGHMILSYDGPVARAVAFLDASLGDIESANKRLADAIALADKRGVTLWAARMEYDLARLLSRAGREADARTRAASAARRAEALGIAGLARRANALFEADEKSAPPPKPVVTRSALELTRAGDMWRVEWNARSVLVRDSRGMQLLARLVERAEEEVHVLALAADESGGLTETTSGDVLDERARRAYRERLATLASEIDEAASHNDRGRLAKLEHERTTLEKEIARAVGLGGRGRQAGSATERARVNVQRRIKDAIARVTEHDATVGAFLERSVRTGTFCCYRP